MLLVATPDAHALPWPAEPWSSATNLTTIEDPGTNDWHQDLSGAFWNMQTRRLWVVRNGPGSSSSKVWCLKEDGAGGFVVDTKRGVGELNAGRAEWTGFGDAEAVTQADLNSDTVFVMAEAEEVIRQYTLAVGGVVQPVRTFNTRPHLPVDGGSGSEALAFVPDRFLQSAGFVGPTGAPLVSSLGMGGLFFVGHQNGGRIYVFDLSATGSTFIFRGSFASSSGELKELFFDRSLNQLYLLHSDRTVEVCSLASVPVSAGSSDRRFIAIARYDPPTGIPGGPNLEGLAVVGNDDGYGSAARKRSLFLTIDDGGATSFVQFKQWPSVCRVDQNGSGVPNIDDLFIYLNRWFAATPGDGTDFDFSGSTTIDDLFIFLNAWFAGC